MHISNKILWCTAWLLGSCLPLWAVRLLNVTEAPIYFAVYYKEENQAIKYNAPEQKGYYTTLPNGVEFLAGSSYKEIPFFYLEWPPQKCEAYWSGSCVSRYPRALFFSFAMNDIKKLRIGFNGEGGEPTLYVGKDIGPALYRGWNIQEDRTYFVFYNSFGFDPRYAAYGRLESDIAAGKLNACGVDAKIEQSLRRYLIFARYMLFA